MWRKLSVRSCLDGMSNRNIYIYIFVNDSGKDSIHEERYTDEFRDDMQQFES
jgi:hypothetical protein